MTSAAFSDFLTHSSPLSAFGTDLLYKIPAKLPAFPSPQVQTSFMDGPYRHISSRGFSQVLRFPWQLQWRLLLPGQLRIVVELLYFSVRRSCGQFHAAGDTFRVRPPVRSAYTDGAAGSFSHPTPRNDAAFDSIKPSLMRARIRNGLNKLRESSSRQTARCADVHSSMETAVSHECIHTREETKAALKCPKNL